MGHWKDKRHCWAILGVHSGALVGSKAGQPLMQKTKREIKKIMQFNKLSAPDFYPIKIIVKYEAVK